MVIEGPVMEDPTVRHANEPPATLPLATVYGSDPTQIQPQPFLFLSLSLYSNVQNFYFLT
jgi:hypothetical protein